MVTCFLDGLRGVTIDLPDECMRDLDGPGDVEDAARFWVKAPSVAAQLDAIGHDALALALTECGAWEPEELADEEWTRLRAIWVASGSPDTEDDA